mgnify:FL=1
MYSSLWNVGAWVRNQCRKGGKPATRHTQFFHGHVGLVVSTLRGSCSIGNVDEGCVLGRGEVKTYKANSQV